MVIRWFVCQSWPRQNGGPEGQVELAFHGTNESLLEAGLGSYLRFFLHVFVCVLFGVVLLYIY